MGLIRSALLAHVRILRTARDAEFSQAAREPFPVTCVLNVVMLKAVDNTGENFRIDVEPT
jgi:hypothetical protein